MRQMIIKFDQYCLFSLYHLIKGDLTNLVVLRLWCLRPKGPPDPRGGIVVPVPQGSPRSWWRLGVNTALSPCQDSVCTFHARGICPLIT